MSNNWSADYRCARCTTDNDRAIIYSNKTSTLFLWMRFHGKKHDVTSF